jgi:glycosyltransferase involved in cell wall biosynthesis
MVLLAPIAPAATGNGLAMRVALFANAAVADFDVHVVVVPVAGSAPGATRELPANVTVVELAQLEQIRSGLSEMLGDAAGRSRLALAAPLPRLARVAPPMLATGIAARLPPGPIAVHITRSYLAPLGLALAERTSAPWVTLDLDEDDESLAATMGNQDEAEAYGRLVKVFGPLATATAVAAPREAEVLRTRHGIDPMVIPNAVVLPHAAPRPAEPGPAALLFVGNLTYAPNIEAAAALANDVLPEVRRILGSPVALTIAGPFEENSRQAAGRDPDVYWLGFVPDLAPLYATARVVVAPLRAGGGTRIKLLEAFAHGVPVVSSTAGAAGLEVIDGVHLVIADGASETAAAVARVLENATLAQRLRDNAAELVRRAYSVDAVAPRVREFLAGAASAGGAAR